MIVCRAMAATKKTAKAKVAAALPVSTAAFKHGASAYGARFVKKGFGFSEQEDLEWALGWPHVRRLVDGHPDDADPLVWDNAFPDYDIDFPREQAARRVRHHLFCPSNGDERNKWLELSKPYRQKAGPITEEEARSVITQHLKPAPNLWWWFLPQIILLCEAFVGPEPIAQALVETVEAWPIDLLKSEDSKRSDCVSLLGFLFLRLPEAVRAALETRLRKVLDAAVATIPSGLDAVSEGEFHRPYRAIDRVLNGKKAALRAGRFMDQTDLLFADDDPAFILEWLLGRDAPGDLPPFARLAFLGGEGVLDVEAKWWKKYKEPEDEAQKVFVRDYGRIRSEKMLAIFLVMSQTSKARKETAAWFAAKTDFARPYLERTAAGKDDTAAWAKALLG